MEYLEGDPSWNRVRRVPGLNYIGMMYVAEEWDDSHCHSHIFLCVQYIKLSMEITECPPLLPAGLFKTVTSVEIASVNTAWKLWALPSPAFPTSFVCSICIHTYNSCNPYQHLLSYTFYLSVYFYHILLEYVSRRQRLMATTFTTLSPVSRRIPDTQ